MKTSEESFDSSWHETNCHSLTVKVNEIKLQTNHKLIKTTDKLCIIANTIILSKKTVGVSTLK